MSSHHAAVNNEMLVEKAKVLSEQLNITDFSYSRGWIQRFKQRRDIKRKFYEGEADSADMNAVRSGRDDLKQILAAYNPEDIFNLDETGLFYRLGPNSTLATTSEKEFQRKDNCGLDSKRYWQCESKAICHLKSCQTKMLWEDLQP